MKSFEEFLKEKRKTAQDLGGPYRKVWHALTDKYDVVTLGPVTQMLNDMNDGMDEKEAWDKHSRKFNKIAGNVKQALNKQGIKF